MASIDKLLFEAGEDRRARLAKPPFAEIGAAAANREQSPEFAASVILDEVLSGDPGSIVNCATYLTRVVTLQHMAINALNVLRTSISAVQLSPIVGQGLAVAVCDVMLFTGGVAPAGGSIDLRLAVGVEGSDVVVGLAAYGDIQPVSSASATAALARAVAMVTALRGAFVRAYEPDQMTFGMVLPYLDVVATSRTGLISRRRR